MKTIHLLAAAAVVLLTTSCANDIDGPATPNGSETEVTLTLGLPSQIQTHAAVRAYGDGSVAEDLHYAIYEHHADGTVSTPVADGTFSGAFASGLTTTQSFKVISGKEYDFVFFASAADSPYAFDAATATISDNQAVADGTIEGNLENRDAFFGVHTVKVTGPINATVELRRPFAQLNLGTNDLDEQIVETTFGDGLANLKTSVKTETYKTLNLLTGAASDKVSVTFGSTGIPDMATQEFPIDNPADPYNYLSMNYLLMPAEVTRQNCEFTIYNGDSEVRSFIVPNAPLQRNYRTNVYGTLLTNAVNYTIEIKPLPEGDHNPDIPVVVADGVLKTDKVYSITNANGLTWISAQTNANINDFAGKTIELGADIDMNNQAVQPIKLRSPEKPVTFDGAGHTIKNMKFSGKFKSLIESTTGTVKNLTIDGMTGNLGDGRRFSGLVANSYGNFENVHVKNVKLSTRDGRIGAIVGIHNGGSLINCSVENAEITGAWSVGGMAGAVNETPGFHYKNCVVKNVKVTNTHGYGGVYDKMTGVIVGNINLADVIFTDCQIIDCDTELPIYNTFVDYTWNGTVIKADIDEEGNPLPAATE